VLFRSRETFKTQAIYHKNKESFKNIVFKQNPIVEPDLLNEDNIKDLGK